MTTSPQGRCRFGLFDFDLRTGELRREGEIVKLPPQPARVLALLLGRPGEIVLREELRAHLWGEDTFVDFERGLNFCILQVRTALGDSSDNPRFVQTVPRKGYRFIAPVSGDLRPSQEPPFPWVTSVPASPPSLAAIPPSFGAAGVASPRALGAGPESRRRQWAAVAIGALLILAPVAWLAVGREASSALPATSATRVRIAVLPFVNQTGDRDADYLVDGLTDELIAQLGRVSPNRLGVIARTSVMRYRNTDKTVAEIGRDLDVGYVLEGGIRREGTRLRVTTALVKVSDQAQVWSDAFERGAGDSMDLQTDVAIRVARALALELVPGVAGPSLPRQTKNADAWDAYLRGRYFMSRGRSDDVRQGVEHFETAVRLDPDFASAWAELAQAHHVMVMVGATAPMTAYPRAQEAAARARALDESRADAHLAHGVVRLWYDWRPDEAARAFERALALNPSDAAAHHDYAWSLVALGRFDEAVAHITAARDLDPLSVRANNDIGWLFLHLRQPTEATRACQHTLAIQPESLEAQACLERAFLQRGLYDEALGAAQASLPKDAELIAATDGGDSRDRMQAIWRWRLEKMQEASRWVSPYALAQQLVMLGETERAMEQLEEAYAQRVAMMVFLKTDPIVDTLRSNPRFDALLQKVTQHSR